MDADSQILGHEARFHSVNAGSFQVLSVFGELGVVIEFGSVGEPSAPSKDTGNGVGAGLLALLVVAVMTSDSSVSGFGFDGLAVGANEDTGHESERSKSFIREDIVLYHVYGMKEIE